MKPLKSHEVRQMFLDFFEEKGHQPIKSASLVPVNDPSLLWINSGVATLKKYFDGTLKPDNPRIVSSQKSIRTNDIENVGKTARHHTLFEMLGNFSIGDYFKEEAIEWAWEFLTSDKWLNLDPERLYVTVYPADKEAKEIWKTKIGLADDHIIEEEGNFWDIGLGPSGPDTEIFYDRGEECNNLSEDDPENYPGGENERWLEIWNLVFSEFNHKEDDTYEPLPNKNIDTGMGLERIVSVLQDTPTNFETDLFFPIIQKVEAVSGKTYGEDSERDVSFKVIADHVRAVTFAIGDGALPSNEGRGYVLRRLLRRSVMHGRKLGIDRSFLTELIPVIGEIMKEHYPEVQEKTDFISRVIQNEEERFHETINEGWEILSDLIERLKKEGRSQIEGADTFRLYDTYGFPVELTEEFAEEAGLSVDLSGFEKEMEKQRERARSARGEDHSMSVQSGLLTEVTEESNFVGYESFTSTGKLVHISDEAAILEEAEPGSTVQLVFDETPFYSEKGGQVGDTGVIKNDKGETVAVVKDVQSAPAGQPLHITEVKQLMKVGEVYHLTVDVEARLRIMRNHTATHLLHQALKDTLGDHANQAGSLVASDMLRFDFTHFGQVTPEELNELERIVNEKIWASIPVEVVETNLEKAKELGAMALFGEKYGENVRVVLVGDYSKELCGGTHVRNTSEIGLFKIISESGVGAGVRRIVARTSADAYKWLEEQQNILKEAAELVKAQKTSDVPTKIRSLQQQLKEMEHENESMQAKLANAEAQEVFNQVKEANGYTYIAAEVDVNDMAHLRQLADQWKQQNLTDVLVLGLRKEGKANLLVAMSQETVKKGLKAGDLIKAIAPMVGGGGGGRPDMAQAGGKKPDGFPQALAHVAEWLEQNG
ncbi:alanine--tRNA ligase [Atopococcus tabaci]|uniref:alanine--tRNA ligase n=1 Tax=Atopococcus tabaci TaxID=269774 RepID=UPI00042A712D|nr:alanine--tRNA ligase [Atopococcus tabaci]